MYAEFITWLTKNAEAILVGVVASLLVLFGQSTVRTVSLAIAILITRRWHLRLLWRFGAPQRVVVVSGAVEGVTDVVRSAILAGPDAHAANIMLTATEDLYPKCEVRHVYSSSFPPELYKEDLIVVGGPINNSCTAAILRRLHGQLDFRNDFDLHVAGRVFATTYDDDDEPIRDHGAIVRMKNPFDRSKTVLLVLGCDTYGVLAGAMVIGGRKEVRGTAKKLGRRLGLRRFFFVQDYVAIFNCELIGDNVGDVWLKHVENLQLPDECT